jgi:hypothetical protein
MLFVSYLLANLRNRFSWGNPPEPKRIRILNNRMSGKGAEDGSVVVPGDKLRADLPSLSPNGEVQVSIPSAHACATPSMGHVLPMFRVASLA